MYGKDLARMFLPSSDRKLAHADVEQFYTSIAARGKELVLVLLRPGNVKEAVLGLEEFLADDAFGGEVEDVEAAVAYLRQRSANVTDLRVIDTYQPKVGTGANGYARVEEGRVFDAVWVEA